jgi:hypothetical protein
VESTRLGDESEVGEGVVGARGSGESWDSFQYEAAAIEKVCDDGAQRGEDSSGIRLPFACAIVREWLARKAHQEEVNVRMIVIEGEVRGVTTDDLVAWSGERADERVNFYHGMWLEADKFSGVEHAASASTQFNGQVVSFATGDADNRGSRDLDEPDVVVVSDEGGGR